MEIICPEEGEFNMLYYSRKTCKTGVECFSEYVKLLYDLRKNKIISILKENSIQTTRYEKTNRSYLLHISLP